jgi:hypothetical protein
MLKQSLFLCLFALSRFALGAPQHGGQEVLFEPKSLFPAQGGPGFKTLLLPEGTALLVGGTGSLLVGNNVGLGAGGYSMADPFSFTSQGQVRDLGLSFGGLVLDYSFYPRQLFYLNYSVMGGIGQAYIIPRVTGGKRVNANFAVLDPQFNLMLNVTRELRVALGLGLFITYGADLNSTLGTNLSGANFQMVLNYGKL